MINRCVLVGRIVRDPEPRKTATGLSVVNFTLAINRRFARDNEEKQTDYINCVVWRAGADFMANYVKKGALIGAEGWIQTRTSEDREGNKHYITEVVCENVQLLVQKRENESANATAQGNNSSNNYQNSMSEFEGDVVEISNEDLPF